MRPSSAGPRLDRGAQIMVVLLLVTFLYNLCHSWPAEQFHDSNTWGPNALSDWSYWKMINYSTNLCFFGSIIKQAVVIIAVMISDNPIYASLDQSQTVQPQSPGSQTEGSPLGKSWSSFLSKKESEHILTTQKLSHESEYEEGIGFREMVNPGFRITTVICNIV